MRKRKEIPFTLAEFVTLTAGIIVMMVSSLWVTQLALSKWHTHEHAKMQKVEVAP